MSNDEIFHRIESFLVNTMKEQSPDRSREEKKRHGVFYTTTLQIIDEILSALPSSGDILHKKILEPSCGNGIFILEIIHNLFRQFNDQKTIRNFIENDLIFTDIDPRAVELTKKNINNLYKFIFATDYTGKFNAFVYDFTQKIMGDANSLFPIDTNNPLSKYIGQIDFVIGNPPYISLYGRRGKKKSEDIRNYYLDNYKQFPSTLKNGKINYIMLFIENAIELIKPCGKVCFIIDISFFETPFLHTRKFLLENTKINRIIYNINEFNVGSGQLIIELEKNNDNNDNNEVILTNHSNGENNIILQKLWYKPLNEYKFTIPHDKKVELILQKILDKNPVPLFSLYPNKNLRTCVMPLDMEEKFEYKSIDNSKEKYFFRYYKGSLGLKEKYGKFHFDSYIYFDKKLQQEINDKLKIALEKEGIKNKKRIGLGEMIIYENPKLFVRQSAKEIIASYDDNRSASNNSLYVFSLRDNSEMTKNELLYICGILNSTITTFFSQQNNIIRYIKGKQPQMKISDLYRILVPQNANLKSEVIDLVKQYYKNQINKDTIVAKVDSCLFEYYNISTEEILRIRDEIDKF